MKMRKYLIVIGGCLLFLGCAKSPIVWTKSNYSQQELQKDDDVCQFYSKTMSPPAGYGDIVLTMDYQKLGKQFYLECMESKGWKKE